MYPLFETIKILDGLPQHLNWHQTRLNDSYKRLFNSAGAPNLENEINVPGKFRSGLIKCKFFYSKTRHLLEYTVYKSRKISSLRIVNGDHIEYSMKYTDRSALNLLASKRKFCDEILIIKNNFITDTSYTNIVFHDGNQWVTPRYPLLNGTCRNRLLKEGRIIEADIALGDIYNFTSFKLINAMNDLDESEELPVHQIQD